MKDRDAQSVNSIYEMWVKLQALLEKESSASEGNPAEQAGIIAPVLSRTREGFSSTPFAVTQYFLTMCVKPSPEILTVLPDDLFTEC